MENEHGTIGKSEIELNNGLQFKVSICFTGTSLLKVKNTTKGISDLRWMAIIDSVITHYKSFMLIFTEDFFLQVKVDFALEDSGHLPLALDWMGSRRQ